MLDNVGLRYPHRASGAKAPRTLRPLPLLWFAASATGGAHLCSIQYYLRFWLSICRTSLAVSALRIMRYCLYSWVGRILFFWWYLLYSGVEYWARPVMRDDARQASSPTNRVVFVAGFIICNTARLRRDESPPPHLPLTTYHLPLNISPPSPHRNAFPLAILRQIRYDETREILWPGRRRAALCQ